MKKIFPAILFIAIVSIIFLGGCVQDNPNPNDLSKTVEVGDTIKVEYRGTLADGSVFDSSARIGKPLEFAAGKGQMIKGFDNAVLGMDLNEEKNISIKPEEAYGNPDPSLILQVSKEKIADFNKLTVGMTVSSPQAGNGVVKSIDANFATIDFNPSLAGKTLNFWIKVVSIVKKTTPAQ